MSIHELMQGNFSIAGRQIKTLNINMPGNVLVFFKMDSCGNCRDVQPVFYQLAGIEKNISYAIVNLTHNRGIVNMSRATTTPITAVPFLILYIGGSPRAIYRGKKTIPNMRSFINKALSTIPQDSLQQQTQVQPFMPQQSQGRGGGMYGSGGYSQPQMGPQQGHAGFSQSHGPQPQGKAKSWQPEIGNAPNMQGIIKGSSNTQYAYLNDMDEEDDEKLLLPNQVTPHNIPWESGYKRMDTLD